MSANATWILSLAAATWTLVGRIALADEPTVSQCLAANEDAQRLRRAGKLVQAQDRLRVCVARTCPVPIRDDCNTWLGEVTASIPSVVLEAKDPSGRALVDVRVTVDGAPFADSLTGRGIPLDPGPHSFVFRAAGMGEQTVTAVVFEGRKLQSVTAILRPIEVIPPPVPKVTDAPPPPPVVSVEAPGKPVWPLALAWGFAAAGAAVAGISGGLTLSATSQCPNTVCPSQSVIDTARTGARVADVGAGVALAGALAGVALILFLPSDQTAVSASAGPGSAVLLVRFP